MRTYPNPVAAAEDIRLNWNVSAGAEAQVRIWDIKGSLVLEKRMTTQGKIATGGTLGKGLYILEFAVGQQRLKQKLVIY